MAFFKIYGVLILRATRSPHHFTCISYNAYIAYDYIMLKDVQQMTQIVHKTGEQHLSILLENRQSYTLK